jgi:hypothetical protein
MKFYLFHYRDETAAEEISTEVFTAVTSLRAVVRAMCKKHDAAEAEYAAARAGGDYPTPPDDLGLSITVVEVPSEPNRIEIANIFVLGGMDTCVHPSVPGTRQRVKCVEIISGRDEVEAFVQKGGIQ